MPLRKKRPKGVDLTEVAPLNDDDTISSVSDDDFGDEAGPAKKKSKKATREATKARESEFQSPRNPPLPHLCLTSATCFFAKPASNT